MSWSMSGKVYLKVYLKAFLNILLGTKFKVKGLQCESQLGIRIVALEEAAERPVAQMLSFFSSCEVDETLSAWRVHRPQDTRKGSQGFRIPSSHRTILAHELAGLTSLNSVSLLLT